MLESRVLQILESRKPIQRKGLLQELQCPPILQFTYLAAIVVPLIKGHCMHTHVLVYN
jgi:hypothetical protein